MRRSPGLLPKPVTSSSGLWAAPVRLRAISPKPFAKLPFAKPLTSCSFDRRRRYSTFLTRDTGSSSAGYFQRHRKQIVAALQNKKAVYCHSQGISFSRAKKLQRTSSFLADLKFQRRGGPSKTRKRRRGEI